MDWLSVLWIPVFWGHVIVSLLNQVIHVAASPTHCPPTLVTYFLFCCHYVGWIPNIESHCYHCIDMIMGVQLTFFYVQKYSHVYMCCTYIVISLHMFCSYVWRGCCRHADTSYKRYWKIINWFWEAVQLHGHEQRWQRFIGWGVWFHYSTWQKL